MNKKNNLILILALSILSTFLFVYADTNGVWHRAEDTICGTFGLDEIGSTSCNNFTFANSVYFNDNVYFNNICINGNCQTSWPTSFIQPPLCTGTNKALQWTGTAFQCVTIGTTTPPSTCSDTCSYTGQTTCSGSNLLTCGNYDADTCLEWNSGTYSASCGTCTPSCPLASTVCSGTTYTGSNGCSGSCNVVGTKTCTTPPSNWYQTDSGTFIYRPNNYGFIIDLNVNSEGSVTGVAYTGWYTYVEPTNPSIICYYDKVNTQLNPLEVQVSPNFAISNAACANTGEWFTIDEINAAGIPGLSVGINKFNLLGSISGNSGSGGWAYDSTGSTSGPYIGLTGLISYTYNPTTDTISLTFTGTNGAIGGPLTLERS